MAETRELTTERFLTLATRLWRAMGVAMPKLSTSMQAVLRTRLEDSDVRWALALGLAGWQLSRAGEPGHAEMSALLEQTGATPLIQQLRDLDALLPEAFRRFLKTARDASGDPQLAQASAYLSSAVNELGEPQRTALQGWLRSALFQEYGRSLIRRFPEPGSSRPPVWGSPPKTELPTLSRGERFDRADFRPPRPLPSQAARPHSAAFNGLPPSVPTPQLEKDALTRTYLVSLGWSGAEAEGLISGPRRDREPG